MTVENKLKIGRTIPAAGLLLRNVTPRRITSDSPSDSSYQRKHSPTINQIAVDL